MRILSWNVNGLRACEKKGFSTWLGEDEIDVLGLQEVRALPEQLAEHVRSPEGWFTHFSPAERKGYSGVGLFSRIEPDLVETSLGVDEFDAEGRVQIATFGELVVANVYFPNGSGKNRDNSRIPFKLDFYQRLFDLLETDMRAGRPMIVMGDFNTAHREVDLARPKQNHKTSGFRPEEREELDRWIREGWLDTFRHFNGDAEGHYTWWSNRKGVREKNVGWRIDYALASPGLLKFVEGAEILPNVMGSDHCPIVLNIKNAALKASWS